MPTRCLAPVRKPLSRFRLITLSLCVAPGLLGALAVYVGHAWFAAPAGKTTVPKAPAAEIKKPAQPETARERLQRDRARAQASLATSRQEADNGRKQAAEKGKLWAAGAVSEGLSLARKLQPATPTGATDLVDGNPTTGPMPATGQAQKWVDGRQRPAVNPPCANVAQYQSRLLYGALGLNDDQWRQVNRTLTAYYQEGNARKLNREARPPTEADGWQQQRADLSRRAFAAVDARLTPEQSAHLRQLCQAENLLWPSDVN